MRVTVTIDSATPQQVYNATCAYQRTIGMPMPVQINDVPTVKVSGVAMTWRSPALYVEHVSALLAEFARLESITRLAHP